MNYLYNSITTLTWVFWFLHRKIGALTVAISSVFASDESAGNFELITKVKFNSEDRLIDSPAVPSRPRYHLAGLLDTGLF